MAKDEKSLRVLQVYNISTAATDDVIKQLFQYCGKIQELQVYPIIVTANTQQKVAYVRYEREKSVLLAQHLTNTVFYDRALVCIPATSNVIPDEDTALKSCGTLDKRVLPPHVTNKVETTEDGQKMLYTIDPTLTELGLPQYPPLGADLDPEKVEQTRRTIYVGNLKKDVDPDDVIKFFNSIGEVMYLRMANTTEEHDCAYCYVEFTNQESVPQALQNDGVEFQGQPMRIQHSRVAIVKPQQKTKDQAMEEIEEAMRKRDSNNDGKMVVKKRSRSPSPRRPRKSRSRSPRRRSKEPSDRGRDKRRDREKDRGKDRKESDRDKDRGKDRKESEYEKERDKEREKRRDKERESRKDDRGKERSEQSKDSKRDERNRDSKQDRSSRKYDSRDIKKDDSRRSDRDKSSKKDERSKDRERGRTKDKEKGSERSRDRRRSKSPRKDVKKERRSRSKSPERKKKREELKSNEDLPKEKSESKPSVGSVSPTAVSSSGSLDNVEISLRERLLAKKLEKHRRESDEMDISD